MCVNNKCNKRALDNINHICVTQDGDFVCDKNCKIEYEKQKYKFFNQIIHDERKTLDYLNGY